MLQAVALLEGAGHGAPSQQQQCDLSTLLAAHASPQQHAQHHGQLLQAFNNGGGAAWGAPNTGADSLSSLLAPAGNSGSSSPTAFMPRHHQQAQQAGGPRVFVPDSLKAAPAAAHHQDALLHAALAQQAGAPAAAAAPSSDSLALLQLLQQQQQLLMQVLQQQQQQQGAAAAAAAAQPGINALAAALASASLATPPGLGQPNLAGSQSHASLWPLLADASSNPTAATAAAAAAAAVLAAQQQQSAAALGGMAQPGMGDQSALLQLLLAQQGGMGGAPAGAAAPALFNQLQPWAAKALAAQQQSMAPGLAAYTQQQQQLALAGLLGPTGMGTAAHPAAAASSSGGGSLARHSAPPAGLCQPQQRGRRGSNRRSSASAAVGDLAAFGLGGLTSSSRAGSGSDICAPADGSRGLAVLPEGVTAKDLSPAQFTETWSSGGEEALARRSATATDTGAASPTSQSSFNLACASASSCSSSSSSDATLEDGASTLSSSTTTCGSKAASKWESRFASLTDAVARSASNISSRAARRQQGICKAGEGAAAAAAACDAAVADVSSRDQAAGSKAALAPAAGAASPSPCPSVWFPGQREAAGDDGWYLQRPATCRLFVGNIGCWVDEAMLLGYFGTYGHVVDVQVGGGFGRVAGLGPCVWSRPGAARTPSTCSLARSLPPPSLPHQVMWNTKLKARGRLVNREFAFISYSSPLEAARAVHWLDGCRLPDLEKDGNGITVEYENGEGDAPPGGASAANKRSP
jgi:hypothetical protein